jgi:AcrR family transcriptional regulator
MVGAHNSRQRMVDSTIALLQEQSAGSVTIDAVLTHSGAPRGSVYYHFPGGRDELVFTALRQFGEQVSSLIQRAGRKGDALSVLMLFVRIWKQNLAGRDLVAGCPVVAQAVDNREDLPEANAVVRGIFTDWERSFSDLLVRSGVASERARRLTTLTASAIEGAVILCRVHQSTQPLDDVMTELTPLLSEQTSRGLQ